jgi:hypothetical protein
MTSVPELTLSTALLLLLFFLELKKDGPPQSKQNGAAIPQTLKVRARRNTPETDREVKREVARGTTPPGHRNPS